MEIRGPALGWTVIPRHPRERGEKAGIHCNQESLDSRFCGNDGLKNSIHLIIARSQDP